MATSEHNHQAIVVAWFRSKYRDALIFAVPNGGNRNMIEAARLKKEGVLAGIPDLVVISKNKVFFIEMKNEAGRLSATQKTIHEKINRLGFAVYTCYGYKEAQKKIEEEMI